MAKEFSNSSEWCIKKHQETNHQYDQYLPYEFHLRMVHEVFKEHQNLLDDKTNYFGEGNMRSYLERVTLRDACRAAVFAHDLLEDCRVSYNDVKDHLGQEAADIVYAVTNMRGKNRAERANAEYYKGIRETPGAVFVKLCDRIANVQYSKLTKSRMFEVYEKENPHFVAELGWDGTKEHPYMTMFTYLIALFNS